MSEGLTLSTTRSFLTTNSLMTFLWEVWKTAGKDSASSSMEERVVSR